jgi:hypothetical protein
MSFDKIVEEIIREAQERGKFDSLKGQRQAARPERLF